MFNRTLIGHNVLLNRDVDGNNMNKSDAIDKENYIPGEPIFTGDIDIPGMTEENAPVLQFLDCLKNIEKCTEIEPVKCGKILTEFARENLCSVEDRTRVRSHP